MIEPSAADHKRAGTPLDAAGGDLVPGWMRRLAAIGWRVLVTVALAVVVVRVAVVLGTVTASILFASLIVAAIVPLYAQLRDARGWSHIKAAAVASVVALGFVVVTAVLLVFAFAPYVVALVRAALDGFAEIENWLVESGVPPATISLLDRAADGLQDWLASSVQQIVGPIASLVTVFILGGFLTFYLLLDGEKGWHLALRDLDDWREQALTSRAVVALDRVGNYLRNTVITASIAAITGWLYLTLLGVPLAAPLAVLLFFTAFVPYIGALFGTITVVLAALAAVGLGPAAILLGLIVITRIVGHRVLGPYVYINAVNVHPALVIVALPAGAAFFGLAGLIAAVPVALVAEAFAPALVRTLDTLQQEPMRAGALVPTWLDRLAQWSWRALVVIGLVGLGIGIAISVPGVVVPVVLALVLAATFKPAVDRLTERGLGRGQSALLVTATSSAIVAIAVVVALVAIGGSMTDMVDLASVGADKGGLGTAAGDVVDTIGSGLVENAAALLASVAGITIAVMLAALLTFYFLRDGAQLWDRVLERVDDQRRPNLAAAGSQATGILNGYMVGTGIISLFAAVTQWLIMVLLGLPLAFPVAVLTFFGNFIPYIGGAITTFIGFLVAVAVGTTTDIVLMAIYTLVFNIVQGNFVQPLVYGKAVSLHPAIVLLAIPAGGAVAGVIGMFLVVPFLGVVAATWRLILHLFDPESAVPTEGSDWPPIREPTPAARAPTAPVEPQAGSSTP